VRELEHAIEHAVVLASDKEIGLEHLPSDIAGSGADLPGTDAGFRPLSVAVKEFEREYLLRALTLSSNKRTRAADLLGISRKNLWEKLRAHGITESRVED
jgi:DNA-binding NtrC family response regulator